MKPKISKYEITCADARMLYENGTWQVEDLNEYVDYWAHGNDYGNWAKIITPQYGNYTDGTRSVHMHTKLG